MSETAEIEEITTEEPQEQEVEQVLEQVEQEPSSKMSLKNLTL